MGRKISVALRILLSVAFAAFLVVFSVLALIWLSDVPNQEKDVQTVEELNAYLSEHQDEIGGANGYLSALAVLSEGGMADIEFYQNNPQIYYVSGSKAFKSRQQLTWYFSNYNYDYSLSTINFYDCTEEIICSFYGTNGYTEMYLFSVKLDVEDLKGQIGGETVTVDCYEEEYEGVSYFMTHSVFYDGSLYTYRESKAYTFEKEAVADVSDVSYFGYNLIVLDGVTEIPSNLFSGSFFFAVQMADTVRVVAEDAFQNCLYLESVRFSESLETIESGAFSGCRSLIELDFNENLLSIGEEAFSGCYALSRLSVPSSLAYVAENSFLSCDNISVVNCQGTKEQYNALSLGSILPSFTSRVLRYEGNDYYSGWLRVVYDTEALTYAYQSCVGIVKNVYINTSSTSNEVTYSSDSVADGIFAYDTFMRTIRVKDGVKSVGASCFYHTGTRYVSLPASVEEIGSAAFSGCYRLQEIAVDEENECFASADGVLFALQNEEAVLLCFPSGYEGAYAVPETISHGGATYRVTEIADGAFAYAARLTKVTIPQGIVVGQDNFLFCQAEVER